MAKNKKSDKKNKILNISFTPFLYIGFIVVCATALLQSLVPGFPAGLRNVLYILGVLAMLLYMLQAAFERRTGKRK